MPFGQPPARPAAFQQPPAAPPAAAPPPPPAGVGAFQRGAAPAARPPVAAGTSRWAGVQSAKERPPFLGVGHYRLRVLGNEMGYNPESREESFKAALQVVEAAPNSVSQVGETVALVCKFAGKAATRNAERARAYVVAAAGYSGDPEFDAFDPDPDNGFLASVTGAVNAYSQAGFTIVGRLVDVHVTQGGPVKDKNNQPTGEFYNDCAWRVVPEAEQDKTPKPAWAAA